MLLRELNYAFRQLKNAPGFSVLTILTLALGIGASTAVFTVVDSVLLKPLSYRNSGELVVAWERVKFLGSGTPYVGPNPRHAGLWQKRATAFSGMTLVQEGSSGVSLGREHPQVTGTIRAYPNLLDVLQVKPILGSNFRPESAVKGRDNVVILTYGLWQTLFHGGPDVIGKMVRLADVPRQIVGVLPPTFRFPNANALSAGVSKQAAGSALEPALIIPASLDLNDYGWNGDYGNWVAIARLKPGFAPGQAEAQLNTIQAQIVREMPAEARDNQANSLLAFVQPMQEAVVGSSEAGLWLLMAAVLGLMLIACVNLANAQLGRAFLREREAAIRKALGAGTWQLLFLSFTESAILCAAGGLAGILLAFGALKLFASYTPIDLPRLEEIQPDFTVLLFALALILGSALLFGIMPALHLMQADPQRALQENGRGAQGSRQSLRLRRGLIALQVFGCTALLLVTGLFAKSLLHLLRIDKGFDTEQVTAAEVDLSSKTYDKDQARSVFSEAVLNNLRAIPGVRSAALVSAMPLEGETWIDGITRADRPAKYPPLANFRWVSPGYFETIRERLVAGRFFEERDRALHSVVISEASARSAWPGESPVGRQIRHNDKVYSVIGVVADAHNNSLKLAPANMVYFHFVDRPPYSAFFLVRSAAPANSLVPNVRQAIWRRAPDATIARVKTLDSQLTDSLAPERFQASVLMAFGASALLLAMLGVYGVLSYLVAGNQKQIGIRMALGASRQSVYGLTFKEALVPVLVGLVAGWALSLALAGLVRTLLYGVESVDLGVTLTVAVLLLVSAMLAAFLPARRAASVDPMTALRAE